MYLIYSYHLRAVEYHCLRNLKPGILSPFNSIIDYQRYASSLAMSESNPPTITISPTASHFTYCGKTLEVSQWISGLHQLLVDTQTDITKLCRGQNIDINIPSDVEDDMTNTTRGYSWLDNGTFVHDRILLQILMHDTNLRLCHVRKEDNQIVWNGTALRRILQDASGINSKLSVLCHTLCGQPPRGSE